MNFLDTDDNPRTRDFRVRLAHCMIGKKQEDGPPRSFFEENGQIKVYTTLCCGGIHEEGQADMKPQQDMGKAAQMFLKELRSFIGKKKRVVWRRRPEIGEQDGRFSIYARLWVE